MPSVTEHLAFEAPLERVWKVVSDPYSLPRWWPRVQRVEEVSDAGWTTVLMSDRGKPIRADYTLERTRPMELLEWQQELEETPFERMLSLSRIVFEFEWNEDAGATVVVVRSHERLRGLARLGSLMVRRATRKRLTEALDNLSTLVE
ncbi:MAG TPA: SRPBCC family protein [Thermoleophilaceae bacterium]|nr:SRPBCC family protein [Thermoleophilaceae bacterium]